MKMIVRTLVAPTIESAKITQSAQRNRYTARLTCVGGGHFTGTGNTPKSAYKQANSNCRLYIWRIEEFERS